MTGPELVFLHIPKTAGTSQQTMFNDYYGRDNVFWIGRDCDPDIRRYPAAAVSGHSVVGGHKRLAFYPAALDVLYCALVRDPVERAISLFGYYTQPALAISEREQLIRAGHIKEWGRRGLDPDSMADSIRNCRPFRREISNYQCRYLSRTRATFAAVQASLRDADFIIGSVAAYDLFHARLAELLDWAEQPPSRVNRSRDDYAASFLRDEALVRQIRDLNREDEKLVQWVQDEQGGLWSRLREPQRRRRRLRAMPLRPGRRRQRTLRWEEAGQLWPPRGRSALPWPLSRMMIAEPARLIYLPNPGSVDPAIQRMMLDLSGVPHGSAMRQFGIPRVVEHYATGLVLDDLDPERVKAIAQSTEYFRFAVVYDPVARLVDVFRQRFVAQRLQLARWPRMLALLAAAQGTAEPDCERGISFRQFVTAVASGKVAHPLWQRQSRFLPWSDSCDRLYRPGQLQLLERDLARVCRRAVSIERPAGGIEAGNPLTPEPPAEARFADTPAGELPADPAAWRDQLVDASLYELIRACYPRDFKLYNRTAEIKPEVASA
jgi:hypothetical protein